MTVTSTVNKFRYEGNGVTDTFAFTGRVFSQSDLIVEIITRATDALEETLTITTHYTVTINSDESATIVVSGAKIPDNTQDIQIRRAVTQSQTLDLPTGTVFPAISVENALDKLTASVQDLQEIADRAITIPATASYNPISVAELEADKILTSSSDGSQIETTNIQVTDLVTINTNFADITTVADNISVVTTVANDLSGANNIGALVALDTEITALGLITTEIVAVEAIDAEIVTVAGISSDITSVVSNLSVIQNANSNASTILNALGAGGTYKYTFSTTTTMEDPGAGTLRFNNATLASVTAIALDATTAETGNPDISDEIATWGASTSTIKGKLIIKKSGTPGTFAIFNITAAVTDNTGWLQITVVNTENGGSFSNSDDVFISFSAAGDAGADGADGADGAASIASDDGSLTITNILTAYNAVVAEGGVTADKIPTDINALGSVSGTTALDLDDGRFITATIAGTTTFTVSNIKTTGNADGFYLELTLSGAQTVNLPGTVTWFSQEPAFDAAGTYCLSLKTFDGGTNYDAFWIAPPQLASQAQAEAGSNNTLLMTPLRVLQGLEAAIGAGSGTDGQVLTSDGAGGYAFEDIGLDGADPLIQEQVVSSPVASVNFTTGLTGTGKIFYLQYFGVRSSSSGDNLYGRTGNGGVFDSGATDYDYAGSDEPQMRFSGNSLANNSFDSLNGIVMIYDPANTGTYTVFEAASTQKETGGSLTHNVYVNRRKEAAAHDRVQIFFNTGNIASGTFRLYEKAA